MSVLEEAALAYAEQGIAVFPLQPKGKTPLTAHGLEDATTDLMTIETWWSRWPDANVAIRTGEIIVVDEDRLGAFDELAQSVGEVIPDTGLVKTASGRHFYFRQPEGARIRNTAGKLAPGIDTRGDGGYVVAPPSIHQTGITYEWLAELAPVALPGWMVERLGREKAVRRAMPDIPLFGTTAYGKAALDEEIANVANAVEGTRNDTLNRAAFSLGQLVAGGEVDRSDAMLSLEGAAYAAGLQLVESEKTIRSGFQAGLEDARTAPEGEWQRASEPRLRVVEAREPSTPSTEPMFPIETFPTFSQNADVQFDFLVEDLWPVQSLGFIASEPKKGKTWLGLSLAISVAAGKTFLGEFIVPKPRRVLYLALEGQRPGLKHRIGSLARGMNVDPNELDDLIMSYRPRGIDLADPVWAAELAVVANENNIELVIVDVLRNAARIKENDASEFAHFRILLEDTLRVSSVALLHHFTKLSEISKERLPAERMSGSGAMFGALDVGIFITGSDDQARRLKLHFDGRDIAMPEPISVHLEGDGSGPNRGLTYEDTAFWHGDIPGVEEANVVAPALLIAAWVRKQGGDVLLTEAAKFFNTTTDTVRERRKSLETLGINWEKVRDGRASRIHLIDPEMIGEGVQLGEEFTAEFTTETNLPSSVNTAQTSGIHNRTVTAESLPNGSEKSADLQGDFHYRHYRPSTKGDPPLSGQSPNEGLTAPDDIELPGSEELT